MHGTAGGPRERSANPNSDRLQKRSDPVGFGLLERQRGLPRCCRSERTEGYRNASTPLVGRWPSAAHRNPLGGRGASAPSSDDARTTGRWATRGTDDLGGDRTHGRIGRFVIGNGGGTLRTRRRSKALKSAALSKQRRGSTRRRVTMSAHASTPIPATRLPASARSRRAGGPTGVQGTTVSALAPKFPAAPRALRRT